MKVPLQKLWKESASLIILAKNTKPSTDFNYEILVFRRSSKASFMPSSIVFPGGQTEKADETRDWLALYKNLGVSDKRIKQLSLVEGLRPFIFHKKTKEEIDREISLRITSIRETFEEVGLLICKTKKQFQDEENKFSNYVNNFDVKHWQKKVQKNPIEFFNLCQKLEVAPDLWGCYEWAAWLTPTSLKMKRFEAAFFIVALDSKPDISIQETEVSDFLWKTPEELIKSHLAEEFWLPPPQLYELARLCNLPNINDVANFSHERNLKGITLTFPVQYRTKNGLLHVLPGDDIYPETPNFSESTDFELFSDKTSEEMRSSSMNRAEMTSMIDLNFKCNIEPFNGHLKPKIFNKNKDNVIKAKL